MLKKMLTVILAVLIFATVFNGCTMVKEQEPDIDELAEQIIQGAKEAEEQAKKVENTTPTESPAATPEVMRTAKPALPTLEPGAGLTPDTVLYKNETFGFSLEFPKSWEGKYSIWEFDNGISVSFKPGVPLEEGKGHLFSIVKNPSEEVASFLDGAQYIETGDATYVYGGPTDVTYFEEDPEYDTFVRMQGEIDRIMKTLK